MQALSDKLKLRVQDLYVKLRQAEALVIQGDTTEEFKGEI
jgi:hypothetical protein